MLEMTLELRMKIKITLFVLLLSAFTLGAYAWEIEVGKFDTESTYNTANFTFVNYQSEFNSVPFVFLLATNRGSNPAVTRISSVNKSGFNVAMVEPAKEDGPHLEVSVHYVAVEEGEHQLPDGTAILAGSVETSALQCGSGVNCSSSWQHITLPTGLFHEPPVVLVEIQTINNEPDWQDPYVDGSMCLNAAKKEPPACSSTPWLTAVVSNVTADGFDLALERSESFAGGLPVRL